MKLQNDVSLPVEWLHILGEDQPVLSLEFLIKEATLQDIYDALELIEFKKYMKIEAENINEANRKASEES